MRLIPAAFVVAALAAPLAAQQPSIDLKVQGQFELSPAYRTLTAPGQKSTTLREKVFGSADATLGPLYLGARYMNEVNSDADTHNGVDRLLAGYTGYQPLRGLVRLKSNSTGITDIKVGAHVENPALKRWHVQYVEPSLNPESVGLRFGYGVKFREVPLFRSIPVFRDVVMSNFADGNFGVAARRSFYDDAHFELRVIRNVYAVACHEILSMPGSDHRMHVDNRLRLGVAYKFDLKTQYRLHRVQKK